MSTPSLGPKKVARLASLTGLDLNAAWSSNGRTAHVRTKDHHHLLVDRRTGEVLQHRYEVGCFTDCPPFHDYGPGIKSHDPSEWML